MSAASTMEVHGVRGRDPGQRWRAAFLELNERAWYRLPARARDLRPLRAYGAWSHGLVTRHVDREMHLGTYFLRNRPALELMCRLVDTNEPGGRVEIAVLGCSIGVEVYSIVWTLRSRRPDLELVVHAVDIAADVVEVGRRGVYSDEASTMVQSSIFEGLSDGERADIFDWDGDRGTIKAPLREGITWHVGDASDPALVTSLGAHDVVIANNFLCHMPRASAKACLRNLAGFVRPGGFAFVTGVDLDVRTSVALALGWEPIPELRAEIHDGDHLVRSDWPWRCWGLEPLDERRLDWETRYTAVFRIGKNQSRS